MDQIERHLRQDLSQTADQFAPRAPSRIPRTVRRRIRVRQAVSISVVACIAVASALFAVESLRQPASISPAVDDKSGDHTQMAQVTLGEGSDYGYPWELRMLLKDGEKWCLELQDENGNTHECWQLSESQTIDAVLGIATFPFRHGPVPDGTTQVVFESDNGERVYGRVFDASSRFDVAFDVSLFVLDEPARGLVTALDATGATLASQQLPIPGEVRYQSGGISWGVPDVNGMVIAYVEPADFREPPPCLYEAPPGDTASPELIRCFSEAPLKAVSPGIRAWWQDRPERQAPDKAFTDWWGGYPRAA